MSYLTDQFPETLELRRDLGTHQARTADVRYIMMYVWQKERFEAMAAQQVDAGRTRSIEELVRLAGDSSPNGRRQRAIVSLAGLGADGADALDGLDTSDWPLCDRVFHWVALRRARQKVD